MGGNSAEDLARSFFEHFGAPVRPIPPVPDQRRADFQATLGDEIYIVEVKARDGDVNFRRAIEEVGEAECCDLLARTNPVSRQIREGIAQLRATPAPEDAFHLLALVAADDAPDVAEEQFKATLYGSVEIVVPNEHGTAVSKTCLYFTHSEFFRAPDVDGAILLLPRNGAYYCLNEFSPRSARLRGTRIYKALAAAGAVLDPEDLVNSADGFALHGDLPREDPAAMLRHLKQRYGLSIAYDVRFQRLGAAVAMPRCPEDVAGGPA